MCTIMRAEMVVDRVSPELVMQALPRRLPPAHGAVEVGLANSCLLPARRALGSGSCSLVAHGNVHTRERIVSRFAGASGAGHILPGL